MIPRMSNLLSINSMVIDAMLSLAVQCYPDEESL